MIIEDRKGSLNNNTNNFGVLQNIVLENREKLSISGVNDVLSFDDQIVILETRIRIINSKRGKFKN